MNEPEPKKASKLSLTDKKILTVYSDMSMETGARAAAGTAQVKDDPRYDPTYGLARRFKA